MKTVSLISALLVLSSAQAGSPTDLWRLLGRGDATLPGGDVAYRLTNPSAEVSVDVGLAFGEAKGEGYAELKLTAFKFSSNFNAKELQLFAGDIIRIAGACFNTDPARASAIQAWVLVNDAKEEHIYYTAGTRFAEKDFGPLHLSLEKRTNGRGHSVSVYMSREGTPGQAPWIKTCIASG